MNIGHAIKTLRDHQLMTKESLSSRTGLSIEAIDILEANEMQPSPETLNLICKALEIPNAFLLMFALEESDVVEEKRPAFNSIGKPIKDLILNHI